MKFVESFREEQSESAEGSVLGDKVSVFKLYGCPLLDGWLGGCIQLHGDSSITGQGAIMETLELSASPFSP